MHQHSIRVDDIVIGERHRALSESAVDRLKASLDEIGLRQPITVRIVEEMEVDGDLCAGVPILVAGHHRLAAARSLGWSHIDCVEVDDDAIKAEMWEIAENLHRLDLTKEQRDDHIRRYAELIDARRSLPRQIDAATDLRADGRRKGPQHERGVAAQVAEDTGLSVRTVQRALNPKPAKEVIPLSARAPEDVIIAQANAIISAWNKASPEAREIAMDQMEGGPVFDRSRSAA
ncbi:ParB N-terminal domain-containing protein [Sphingomonas sp. RRHST34]|uniref:ParB N-terminal domain-containing protein n=1 Tax=Sphingomonas citri TaxID=2862499 RepID=A0ABS7BR21_9SPHN|nr:ParB N-terminal domain-containing protein [Sphingomonas citri]MBW6531912.1 ParB N-terminal domain-containing protein [Sphingomonas citri]